MTAQYAPEPCRCEDCKYRQGPPGSDAVLYTGPDTVALVERAAIRDGRYVDAIAWADERMALIHASLEAAYLATRRTLEPAIRAWMRADEERKAEPEEPLPDFRVAEKMAAALMPGGPLL